MNKKHCLGCRDNFYNSNNPYGIEKCWNLKNAKLVWRIPVGHWESPPYKNKKKVRVPDCWHGSGPSRTHYIKPESITPEGYWK
jgi:hypothetical protein